MTKECASANSVRNLDDAPGPKGATANAVSDSMSYLSKLLQDTAAGDTVEEDEDTLGDDWGTAAAATSDSESSREKRQRKKKDTRRGRGRKSKRNRDRSKGRRRGRDESAKRGKNKCPHCKKFGQKNPHPNIPFDKCRWNQKWKGYRNQYQCAEMELPYKPRWKFTPKLGGFPRDSSDSEDS